MIPKAFEISAAIILAMGMASISGTAGNLPAFPHLPVNFEDQVFQGMDEPGMQGSASVQKGIPKRYAIIVGSFKSLENAKKLASGLKNQGYDALIADLSEKGLFRVSIYSSDDKDGANRQLAFVQSNGFPDAWLLVKAEKDYKVAADTASTVPERVLKLKEAKTASIPDSVISVYKIVDSDDNTLSGQYDKLREVLKRYSEIEKNGGWNTIDLDTNLVAYKPGDTAEEILQIREHLFLTGDLKEDSKSKCYDTALAGAMNKYMIRNGNIPGELILPEHIKNMNVPVGERIRQILLNMERFRNISDEYGRAEEYIFVNIPAFRLQFVENGRISLTSPVIVGDDVTKTAVLSSKLSSVVFSPYWNVPQSIIDEEIIPGIAKDSGFLERYNMEWNNGRVRQKPGKYNTLGQIKFVFPNNHEIFIHDTPIKSHYKQEVRAFSHGCIRVRRSRDLAIAILKDEGWTPEKIDAAMHAGTESTYVLKNKIPVIIGYYTAWVDEAGNINFYDDIYKWDESLSKKTIYGN